MTVVPTLRRSDLLARFPLEVNGDEGQVEREQGVTDFKAMRPRVGYFGEQI